MEALLWFLKLTAIVSLLRLITSILGKNIWFLLFIIYTLRHKCCYEEYH